MHHIVCALFSWAYWPIRGLPGEASVARRSNLRNTEIHNTFTIYPSIPTMHLREGLLRAPREEY